MKREFHPRLESPTLQMFQRLGLLTQGMGRLTPKIRHQLMRQTFDTLQRYGYLALLPDYQRQVFELLAQGNSETVVGRLVSPDKPRKRQSISAGLNSVWKRMEEPLAQREKREKAVKETVKQLRTGTIPLDTIVLDIEQYLTLPKRSIDKLNQAGIKDLRDIIVMFDYRLYKATGISLKKLDSIISIKAQMADFIQALINHTNQVRPKSEQIPIGNNISYLKIPKKAYRIFRVAEITDIYQLVRLSDKELLAKIPKEYRQRRFYLKKARGSIPVFINQILREVTETESRKNAAILPSLAESNKLNFRGYLGKKIKFLMTEYGLLTRAHNMLARAGIRTLGQILEMTDKQLLEVRYFGPDCLISLKASLEKLRSDIGVTTEMRNILIKFGQPSEQFNDLLVRLYKEHSIRSIATQFGVKYSKVFRWFKHYEIERRTNCESSLIVRRREKFRTELRNKRLQLIRQDLQRRLHTDRDPIEAIHEMREKGMTIEQIASQLDIGETALRLHLKALGYKQRGRLKRKV